MSGLVRSVKALGEENALLKRAAARAEAEEEGGARAVTGSGARQRTQFAPSLAASSENVLGGGGSPGSPYAPSSPVRSAGGVTLPRQMSRSAAGSSRRMFDAQAPQVKTGNDASLRGAAPQPLPPSLPRLSPDNPEPAVRLCG